MKKLLLFLALWSGAASAMHSDVVPADVTSTMPTAQDQMDLTATMAEQVPALTSEQQEQAIAQAKENVQNLVDACGDNRELLKVTLKQRIKNSLMHPVSGPLVVTFFISLELALTIAAFYGCLYGSNFLAILTTGKLLFTTYPSFSPITLSFLLGSRIGYGLGWISQMQDKPNGSVIAQMTA